MTKRLTYLDFLRVLGCFLVIVNHTNSLVFKASTPQDVGWWLSIVWYCCSKIAVPLFVLVSGACLLPREDSYKRVGLRILRMLCALLLFSYLYYLVGVLETGFTWRRALGLKSFLASVWQAPITDSFWYLYFYIGLLVTLPMLQRLAKSMTKRDTLYFMSVSFGVSALLPLVTHYAPSLQLPPYLDFPLFTGYLGLFFAGLYLRKFATGRSSVLPLLTILATIALSTLLTRLEYDRVALGVKYWFMDDRTAPSILTILCAVAAAALCKQRFDARGELPERASRRWQTLGGCAFGAYLLQDLLIAESRYRFFVPLSSAIPPFAAALVWELAVFVVAIALAWLMKRVPLLNRIT